MSREKTEYIFLVVGESVEMGDEILVGKREEMGVDYIVERSGFEEIQSRNWGRRRRRRCLRVSDDNTAVFR